MNSAGFQTIPPMRKVFKFLVIIFGSLCALLVLAGVALKVLFPPAKIKRLVENVIREKLHREATLGSVDLGLSGIGIDPLTLSEIPNFKAGTFLTAEGVRLRWSLKRLWEGFSFHTLFPSELEGSLFIRHAHNPYYEAQSFALSWNLADVDPTLAHLNGWARLRQGPGAIQNIDQLAASEKGAKI